MQQSAVDIPSVDDPQRKDQTRKPKYDRKKLLLILLMLLIVSQLIVLLANNGFYNEPTEHVKVSRKPVSLTQIKETAVELRNVAEELNEINNNPVTKDHHIEEKESIVKPDLVVTPEVSVKTAPLVQVIVPQKNAVSNAEKKADNKTVDNITMKSGIMAEAVVTPSVESPPVTVKQPAYIKLDIKGKIIDDSKERWECVLDTKNQLMWEVKSSDSPIRNPKNLYSWFDPDNKGLKGTADGGRCKGGVDCDTSSYIEAINQKKLCGYDDWRLPTREEMMGLVNYDGGNRKVKIDTSYFPETLPSWYWTASSNQSRPEFAWYILFKNGISLNDLKENPKHIRLVRSESSS